MPKRAVPTAKSEITFDHQTDEPLYKQLYERLRSRILTGQLETGLRLPSTRALASELGVSRNTTALAYELLLLEGYIESRVGDGTRVARLPTEQWRATGEPPVPLDQGKVPERQRSETLDDSTYAQAFYIQEANPLANVFRVGQPDVSRFPYQTWARLVAKAARHSLPALARYQEGQGYAPLREAIATHIGITRGVHCSADQIILTAGAQGALDLIGRVLLAPGEAAWVESPGYEGASGALAASGAKLIPVPVDREGLDVETGRQLWPMARLVVVTPSHQFPTGVTMSLSRRLALLEWARESAAWIIEDDYDSEYRFSGRPLEALQGLDQTNRVIYVGTFSKVLFPALRLGYLVVPAALVPTFLAARHLIDVHPPILEQLALTDFIVDGHFARYLRKMRGLYLARRNALVEALRHQLGDQLEVSVPEAGLHLVAWLAAGVDGRTIVKQAAANGLHVLAVSQQSLHSLPRDGLLLGFATRPPEQLRAGVETLACAFANLSL